MAFLRFGLRMKIKSLIQLYRKKCNEKVRENGWGERKAIFTGVVRELASLSLFNQLIQQYFKRIPLFFPFFFLTEQTFFYDFDKQFTCYLLLLLFKTARLYIHIYLCIFFIKKKNKIYIGFCILHTRVLREMNFERIITIFALYCVLFFSVIFILLYFIFLTATNIKININIFWYDN